MNISSKHSLTLVELLLASALVGLLLLGVTYFDTFARDHLTVLDRRIRVQNEVSRALEHMSKNLSRGIGDVNCVTGLGPPACPTPLLTVEIRTVFPEGDIGIAVWTDTNENSVFDPSPAGGDLRASYIFFGNKIAPSAFDYKIFFCSAGCLDFTLCVLCCKAEIPISSRIFDIDFNYDDTEADGDPVDNFIDVSVTGCWDPTEAQSNCGTLGNPEVTMQTRIKMPSVSTH
jgi:hypothetical protein